MTNGERINIRVTFLDSVSTRYLLVSVSLTNDSHLTVISRRTDAGMLKIANSSTPLPPCGQTVQTEMNGWIPISTNPRLGRNWKKRSALTLYDNAAGLRTIFNCFVTDMEVKWECHVTCKEVNDLLLSGWWLTTEKIRSSFAYWSAAILRMKKNVSVMSSEIWAAFTNLSNDDFIRWRIH